MSPRPITLGIDPGSANCAFGLMGDHQILASHLLAYRGLSWDLRCALFREEIERCLEQHSLDAIAIEDFVWQGRYAANEPPIRELIGIARSFSRSTRIFVVPAREWSYAITGVHPQKKDLLDGSKAWKRVVRTALTYRLRAEGIDLLQAVGSDPGNHLVDSICLALHTQDVMMLERAGVPSREALCLSATVSLNHR